MTAPCEWILEDAAQAPLEKVARRLGLSRVRTRALVRQRFGVPYKRLIQRHAGMSISDVATALGVSRDRVENWIEVGQLRVRRIRSGRAHHWRSVDPNDLYDFLFARGALYPGLVPAGEWIAHVRDARQHIEETTMPFEEACALFGQSHRMSNLRRQHPDFPLPCILPCPGITGRYDRKAIADWLAAHPGWQQPPQFALSVTRIADTIGLCREAVHLWGRTGDFPQPVFTDRYRARYYARDEVVAWLMRHHPHHLTPRVRKELGL